jgi:dCTP deaminase
MAVLPDSWIEEMSRSTAMITPFAKGRPRKGKISYGTSSYGYDFRLADEFKIPEFTGASHLDPKNPGLVGFRDLRTKSCLVPPNSFVLGRSLEYFRIPRDVIAVCQGKSTYARCGIVVNVTPLEPEWEGYITIALSNTAPVPVKIYAGEGIGQMILLRAEIECRTSYADRKGKYQAQKQIQVSRV